MAGEEYWVVLYKAIADFGDLMRKAAEAKAALEALGKASGEATATQVAGEQKLISARQAEIDKLKSEASAADLTADAYKRYNVQALYGGRSEMGAHLTDLRQELEYETLLNRQRWLLFTSPQQAYAWRQNEYNQRLLMNRAEFAGYFSADQYLAYLQKQIAQWQLFNSALKDRAALYKDNADAALAYYNSIQGTHKTLGELGSNLDLSGLAAFTAAVNAVPDQNTTVLGVDDTPGLAGITKFDAALNAIPDSKTTVLNVVQGKGAELPTNQEVNERVNAIVTGLPPDIRLHVSLDDVQAQHELAYLMQELHQIPPRVDITAGFDDTKAMAEMAAFMAFLKEHRTFGVTEDLNVVAAGGAGKGGGGGSPPEGPPAAAAPPPGEPGDDSAWKKFIADIAAARASYADYIPVVQHANEAMAAQRAELAADTAALHDLGNADEEVNQIIEILRQKQQQEAVAAGSSASAFKAAMAQAIAYKAAQADAAKATADSGGAMSAIVPILATTGQGWLGLNNKLLLFAGLAGTGFVGTVHAWHLALDLIIEVLAVLIPAIGAMVIGLGAFAAAAALANDTLGKISDRMKAVYTTTSATGQALYPLTQNFDKLTGVIRPEVWQLFGDGLNVVNGQMGVFSKIAEMTGGVVDRLAGRLAAFIQNSGPGFANFMKIGSGDLAKLGEIFMNLGNALMNLIKVTQATHIDQIFLNFLVAVSRLLDLITKLPTPVLAAAVALHAIWLYGGLALTIVANLLSPLRALALALGGVTAAESEGGLAGLGKNATGLEKLKATVTDVGNGLGAFAGNVGLVSKGAKEAETATEETAGGVSRLGGTVKAVGTAIAGFAASGFGIATIAVVAVAALGFVAYKLATMKDQTMQWLDSLHQALAQQSVLTAVGTTVQQLAAVTTELATAQKTGRGNATELASAQQDLSGKLSTEFDHVNQLQKMFGTNFVGALELANTAQVKTTQLMSNNGKVWAGALQQVEGLVTGYRAMGQGLTQLQGDVSVQLVTNADQVKSMQTLNQAWDSWLTLVQSGPTAFDQYATSLETLGQNLKVAGASLGGLNSQSLTARTTFDQLIPQMGSVQDAIRTYSAVLENGSAGSADLVRGTKDLIASSGLLGTTNKSVQASLLAVAQEADPSINTWQKLTKWIGKQGAAGSAADLSDLLTKMQVPTANLSADALKLGASLQSDLNPAMAQAIFNAKGGEATFAAFADDFVKFGGSAPQTIAAARNVAQELLAIDGNSSTAKAQFIGMAEEMGYTAAQANALWKQFTTGKNAISATSASAEELRKKMGDAYTATAQLGSPGLWGQIEHGFMSFGDAWGRTLKDFLSLWQQLWATIVSGFHLITDLLTLKWSDAWSAFISAVKHLGSGLLDAVKGIFTPIFNAVSQIWDNLPASWRSSLDRAAQVVGGAFTGTWHTVATGFMNDVAAPIVNWFSATLPRFFTSQIPAWSKVAWETVGGGFKTEVINPVTSFFTTTFVRWFTTDIPNWGKVAWETVGGGFKTEVINPLTSFFTTTFVRWFTTDIPNWAKTAWTDTYDFFRSYVINPFTAFWTKTFVGWVDALTRHIESAWDTVYNWFESHVINPFNTFWNRTLPSWVDAVLRHIENAWTTSYDWFESHVINPFNTFWNRTLPSWLDNVGSDMKRLWSDGWNWFNTELLSPVERWFTSTLPNAMQSAFKNSVNYVITNVINKAIGFINDVTGVVGIPKIPSVPTLAAGGPFAGSVPGPSAIDHHNAVLMGGEYVVRQSARMAAERDFGHGFMNWLNHYDSWSGSGSRGVAASQHWAAGGMPASGGMTAYASGGATPAAGVSFAGYVNPLRGVSGLTPERIDQGVDFSGSGPVGAIGNAVIIETAGGGWPGGPYMSYRLTGGQLAGMTVYLAENITPTVRPGQTVKAGQTIANMFNGGTGIEMGFGDSSGASPLSQTAAAGSISGANLPPGGTQVGKVFDELLMGLGVPAASNFNATAGGKIPGNIPGNSPNIFSLLAKEAGSLVGSGLLDLSGLLKGSLKGILSVIPGLGALVSSGALTKILSGAYKYLISPLLSKFLGGTNSVPSALVDMVVKLVENWATGQAQAKMAAAAAAGANVPGGIAAGSGLANITQLARYLMSHGASAIAAAGIAGDVYGESAGNPESVGSGGFGLIGWTGNTIGLPPGYHGPTGNASTDLAIQIAGTLGYINANGGLGPINAAQNVVQAGEIFSAKYERPLVQYSDTRPSVAAQVLATITGSTGSPTSNIGSATPHAAGGVIDGLNWTDYSIPVPRQWGLTSPVPVLGRDMPAPVIPYHSTQFGDWNDAIDAAWAAQDKFGTDWNDLMSSAKHPTGDAFTGLVHDTYEELKYWNMIGESSLPKTLGKEDWAGPLGNEASVAGLFTAAKYPALSADVSSVRAKVNSLATLWPSLWGPNPTGTSGGAGSTPGTPTPVQLPVTPGPAGVITLNGLPQVNLQPYATAGGPGTPVSPPGTGGYGFGSGGGVLMYAAGGEVEALSTPTLADVAGQFGILVPGRNGYMPVPVSSVGTAAAGRAAASAAPSRSLSEAGAASSRIGVNISGDMVINNPRPERPSDSITRSNQRLAVLAGRGA